MRDAALRQASPIVLYTVVFGIAFRPQNGYTQVETRVALFDAWETVMTSNAELVQHLYDRFNARDIDGVLSALAEDVAWANGMDGGHVHGREAVREYWTRQWAVIDPHVEPVHVGEPTDGSTLVEVHQVVKDLEGKVLLDETIAHRFQVEDDFVTRFDIEGASELSTISH
jgi:ketosteroid isomerase-like protein